MLIRQSHGVGKDTQAYPAVQPAVAHSGGVEALGNLDVIPVLGMRPLPFKLGLLLARLGETATGALVWCLSQMGKVGRSIYIYTKERKCGLSKADAAA